MIVTRYWLAEGLPRTEIIEWTTATPVHPGGTIVIPEIAEVEDMIAPTTPVRWLGLSQPSFDAPVPPDTDPYTLPPSTGAQVVTKAEWEAAIVALEEAVQENARQAEATAAQRVGARKAAIEKLAKSAKLTTAQTEALIGGL